MALAEWGLGTMGPDGALWLGGGDAADLPDTVVSRKTRPSLAAAPPSQGKSPRERAASWAAQPPGGGGGPAASGTGASGVCARARVAVGCPVACALTLCLSPTPPAAPAPAPAAVPSALKTLFGDGNTTLRLSPGGPKGTPTLAGAVAPATTPATGGGRAEPAAIDVPTLAARLAEMAQHHDVTLTLPAVREERCRGPGGREGQQQALGSRGGPVLQRAFWELLYTAG